MANNTRIEPYIRTANTLDKIGLPKQADNVESLMRVAAAMDAGKPLFNNTEEHQKYLAFLKEVKKLVLAENTNERIAGEKSFVLGEVDRYIELWSFMLEQNDKMRKAQAVRPFSMRYAQNVSKLTPEQLSLLDILKPVFRNLWLNGIREEFGNSDLVFQQRELNSIGSSIGKSHERAALEDEDISMRSFNNNMRKQIARAKKMAELDGEEREQSQIIQVQAAGINQLQSPEARQVTELLVSKQLEPIMRETNSIEGKQQIATNAASLINWFLQPVPNKQSSMNLVKEKAQMIGMPSDSTLPADFFDTPAGAPDTSGVRWFDNEEINHLKSRSNPKHAILNMETTGQPESLNEEGLSVVEPGASEDVVQTDVPKKTKRSKAKTPVETSHPLTEPSEPIVNAIDKDIPAKNDAGIQDVDVEIPQTTELEQEVQSNEPSMDEPEESSVLDFVQDIVNSINGLKAKESATEEELSRILELQSDIVMGGDRARRALAIISNVPNDVSILQNEPEPNVYEALLSIQDEEIEEICILIGKGLGVVSPGDSNEPSVEEVQEHAPGTESSRPGQYDKIEQEYPVDTEFDSGEDETYPYTPPLREPIFPLTPSRSEKLNRLVRWLGGMGLGAAAIWGIVSQLAPAGAAKEAINPMQNPQSEYSQPVQITEQPVYTPPVTQPEPQYTPPPVQQPAPQQQVPRQDAPKSNVSPYRRMWDPND